MIYATDMEGTSVYDISKKSSKNIVVLGNEANGVSQEVMSIVGDKLTIPRIGDAESLNVAMATGIICDNFNRVR